MVASEPTAYAHVVSIGVPRVHDGKPGHVYIAFERSPEAGFGAVSFSAELRFLSRECDPAASYNPVRGAEATKETYPVNDVEVGAADFVAPLALNDFRASWEAAGGEGELLEDFSLNFRSVSDAVAAVIDTLGLSPQEGTGLVKLTAPKHMLTLAGNFLGNVTVLGKMLVSLDEPVNGVSTSVVVKIALRCANKDIAEMLMASLL